jgi:3-oxoacyl-[acyl-carrier protein] reductase
MPQGGRIINIGSVFGEVAPTAGLDLYAMGKLALAGLTRTWAHDLAPRGIAVNCLQPGPVHTEMNPEDGPLAACLTPRTAIKRYGRVEGIAAALGVRAHVSVTTHRLGRMHMQTMDQPLRGKVAIVTGAGRGIGRAIACAYARAGAAVGCAARTAADLDATVQAIVACGGQGIAVPTDVTQLTAVQEMVRVTVDTFGGLDILVINAGVNGEGRPVEDSDPEAWRTTLEVNLLGAYYCAQAAIPALRQRGAGKIISVGSGRGHRGVVGRSDYACSKAGLWMLTRVFAQELWPYQISVNELIPGPVVTSMTGEEATQPAIGPTAQSLA